MDNLKVMCIQGIDCYELDGTVYLRLETVARGLGFTDSSKGTEYIRWSTVRSYLSDIGFSQEVAKDTFIPENVFYRLAMKAKNPAAEAFQAKVADEIIPAIRRTGSYSAIALSPAEQRLALAAKVEADAPKLETYERLAARDGLTAPVRIGAGFFEIGVDIRLAA
mgnify:CR=1 FL=1|nr:MAG TPA: antirepressor [Bacteriophage sp.]